MAYAVARRDLSEPPSIACMNIHHTFHGYDGGHKLLSASCDLPSSTKRQLLLLSDMSGPGMVKGFENYLTGYPLAEIGSYAFAQTWYATEMKRPGCVWTHTLLIPFADLDTLCNANSLLPLFHKPRQGEKWVQHNQPIKFTEGQLYDKAPTRSGSPNDEVLARDFLTVLYGIPEKSVVGSADRSSLYENLVLDIWTQQWPRLRRNFTFCTGALAPRMFAEETFDLQIAPLNVSRTFARDSSKYHLVQTGIVNKDTNNDFWARQAAQDLFRQFPPANTRATNFRRFMWEFSSDIRTSRSSFAPLAQTYQEIRLFANEVEDSLVSTHSEIAFSADAKPATSMSATFSSERLMPMEMLLKELMTKVAKAFPDPKEAAQLKSVLFGGERHTTTPELDIHNESLSEEQLLYCLATTDAHSAYDASILNIHHRAALLAQHNGVDAGSMLSLLLRNRISPFTEKVLAGILDGLDQNTVLELSSQNPQLLPVFVSTYPSLANTPQVWIGSVNQQQEILDVLLQQPSIAWEPIVSAVLEAHADSIAQDLVDHVGKIVITLVLDWLNQDHHRRFKFSQEWQRVLRSEPFIILEWLGAVSDANIEILAFVANFLDPHSLEVRLLSDRVWLRLAENAAAVLDQEALTQAAVFLLSVAFYNTDGSASKLAANTFQIVYDAADLDKIPQSSWRLIAHQVPNFYGVKDWDKCERLLQALANNARIFSWPVDDVLKAAPNEQTFKRIVDYCKEFPEGKQFLKDVNREVSQNNTIGTEYQRHIISQKNIWQRMISW